MTTAGPFSLQAFSSLLLPCGWNQWWCCDVLREYHHISPYIYICIYIKNIYIYIMNTCIYIYLHIDYPSIYLSIHLLLFSICLCHFINLFIYLHEFPLESWGVPREHPQSKSNCLLFGAVFFPTHIPSPVAKARNWHRSGLRRSAVGLPQVSLHRTQRFECRTSGPPQSVMSWVDSRTPMGFLSNQNHHMPWFSSR